jgi:hypothetical protein
MSKKLIAVAAAAALAITGLVGIAPANASGITGVVIDAAASTTSSSTTVVRPASAMTSRTLDYNSASSTSRNVVRFQVTTSAATTVSATSASGVKVSDALVDADGVALKVDAGKTTVSGSTTSSNLVYTFYAFTTNSATNGTVTITTATSTLTYVVGGVTAAAYNLKDVVFPTSVLSDETASNTNKNVVHFQITDVYGNAVTSGATATLSGVGGTFSGAAVYDSTRKRWEANVSGTTEANVSMQIALTATDLSANGFAKPVIYAFKSVSAGSLADQVTALTAQVTALTAEYNKLAARWNKLVSKKKAPKKTVATK